MYMSRHSKIRTGCNIFTVCNIPATFLPSAAFLQHSLQHAIICNIPCNNLLNCCNTRLSATLSAALPATRICLQHVVRARWAGARGTPTHVRLEHAFTCPISDLFMLNFCGVFVAPCFPHHACAFCSVLLNLKSFEKNCLRKNIWMCCVLLLSVSTAC
jgi:hypothetical protein